MIEQFKEYRFRDKSLQTISQANAIIEEYQADGLSLTLRQLYYQFVARGLIPNAVEEYKKLGAVISKGREAGLISWSAIEDRLRNVVRNPHWDNPGEAIRSIGEYYQIDKWEDQVYRVEVWVEKDALAGVIEPICRKLDVPFFACRGYVSASEQWRAGKRFESHMRAGQTPVVIHLGDHDPSGIDMTRDNAERLSAFAWAPVMVERLALNMDQVEEYNPPPNPAKMTDSRFGDYVSRYGYESWELDALDPTVLRDLIEEKVKFYLDEAKWKKAKHLEGEHLETLRTLADTWSD